MGYKANTNKEIFMLKGKTLENFADLVIKIGVNLQKGQGLEIVCPVEKSEVAIALTKSAYNHGAKIVQVRWESEEVDILNYANADTKTLCDIPKWKIASRNYLVENNFCYIAISADNPQAFKDIPAEKIGAVAKARAKALKKYMDSVMSNGIRWCVVSVPTLEWAKKVLPTSNNPTEELSLLIEKSMRLDSENPLYAWETHINNLEKRAKFLNDNRFKYLHFENGLGTNLTVGLCDNNKWLSAKEVAKDGVSFVANLPTEEVFTAPHRLKVDGVLKSSLPLCENGQIIDNFSITFKKGKITSFFAEKGYETLKQLIETDKGTCRLGEVALIDKNSPIALSKTLFYNTLFDENASCHLAIGKAYPTTVIDGENLSPLELKKLGANDSSEHFDFMIGTADLKVKGIKENGEEIVLFNDGEWVI